MGIVFFSFDPKEATFMDLLIKGVNVIFCDEGRNHFGETENDVDCIFWTVLKKL